jgi:predicted TIM-barrel fold metal-dependent hydrolase
MIIDVHGLVVCSPEIYSRKSYLLGERGWTAGGTGSRGALGAPDPEITAADVAKSLGHLDELKTDIQLIGPRPYQMMPATAPRRVTHAWAGYYNNVIAAQAALSGGRLRGVMALPQVAGDAPSACFEEIDRCVELGFIGVQLNPDPGEGDGATPGLGDPYWYPLYEKLVAHDLPAIITSGPVRDVREGYSGHYITESSVAVLSILENMEFFKDFPDLKLIVGYGGGSIPYQIGRWRARRGRKPEQETFDQSLRRLYFDTLLYSDDALSLLFKVCGADRCMFATHHPGVGTTIDPDTGRWYGDLKPIIEGLPGLTDADRLNIFGDNALRVFTRMTPAP